MNIKSRTASTPEDGRTADFIFVIPTLEVGGAERVCLHYLNNLQGYRNILVLLLGRGPLSKEVSPNVPILEFFNANHRLRRFTSFYHCHLLVGQIYRLARLARQSQCETIVSFLTLANIIAILAKIIFGCHLKVIVNVHDIMSQILRYSRLKRYKRFLLRWLVRLLFPRADVIVAVAHSIKKDLVVNFKVPAEKIVVIYNPIDVQKIRKCATESLMHPWLNRKEGFLVVAVGRLVKLKGFEVLIRAFAQLPQKLDARLIILGEGEEREALQQLIEQLGLSECVALLGFQENPWKCMARADLFVLPSLTEGLPNVIGEALALGLPVLATDCSSGVREYLENGKCGLLVPPGDPAALADGIARMLGDELLRRELGRRGQERVAQLDLPKVVQVYEALLLRVAREEAHG